MGPGRLLGRTWDGYMLTGESQRSRAPTGPALSVGRQLGELCPEGETGENGGHGAPTESWEQDVDKVRAVWTLF